MMTDPKLALLSADTDKVKEYVFESAKLPEIRGASMILDDLNWGYDDQGRLPELQVQRTIGDLFLAKGLLCKRWPRGNLIYVGGGSLLALVPRDLADELKGEIESLYPTETGTATITCVWRPVVQHELQHGFGGYTYESLLALQERLTPQERQRIADYYHEPDEKGDTITQEQFDRRKNFGELVALQGVALRRAKEEKATAPLFEAVPYARRCAACEIRPAAKFVLTPEPRYLCSVCAQKFGPEARRRRKSRWLELFQEYWIGQGLQVNVGMAADLEDIGKDATGKAKGYVAFIYADGNDVGKAVESARSIEDYQENSRALEDTTKAVTYRALRKHLAVEQGKESPGSIRRFEIITIGGDDLLLIVPADAALAVARDICLEFEQHLPEAGFVSSVKPTMSAGVVIAESHTPIYFLRDLAGDLLKSAKKRARELTLREGTVDFLVLKSQTTLATTLLHQRGAPPMTFTDRERKEKLLLTRRPYTLTELDRLIASARDLEAGGFPGSQLQGYRRALRQGRLGAMFHFLYQYARAGDGQRRVLRRVFDRWRVPGEVDPQPWFDLNPQRGFTRYWTPWADIIEIMDFIRWREGQSEGGEHLESRD
jgi:CRISPR-associated protein Cmr2